MRERPFRDDDLDGVRLVITATGDAEVDAAVSAAARARGIWTNAADQPVDCEFILPAIARSRSRDRGREHRRRQPGTRQGPARPRAALLGDDVAALAEELAAARAAVKARGGSTEDVDWSATIERVLGGVETE